MWYIGRPVLRSMTLMGLGQVTQVDIDDRDGKEPCSAAESVVISHSRQKNKRNKRYHKRNECYHH